MSSENKVSKLPKSTEPGTIVNLLAGRYAGKRAVVLKQLPSGLLLVSGPFKVNGVPLKRVHKRYVIATSTKIDLAGFSADVSDDFFTNAERRNKENKNILDNVKETQKKVDAAIVEQVTKISKADKSYKYLKQYLGATFGLSKGQFPHKMKF